MKAYEILKLLDKYAPRTANKEYEATNLTIDILKENSINLEIQEFTNYVPVEKSAELICDGTKIECKSTSFISGEGIGKDSILTSSLNVEAVFNLPNINFNPHSDAICCSGYFNAPSVAISRKDLDKVIHADRVNWTVVVNKEEYVSKNLIIGNKINPQRVFFAHIDSVNGGSVDNASGVAVLVDIIINNKAVLENNLFVISGNEELSYTFPTYWGEGYRQFEKKYLNILSETKNIYVVDCVGHTKPEIILDKELMFYAIPITNLEKFSNKIGVIAGSISELMKFYHSKEDNIARIKEDLLIEATELVKSQL